MSAADPLSGLEEVLSEYLDWARTTFTGATPEGCLAHLAREVEELREDPCGEEVADCLFLLVNAARLIKLDLVGSLRYKLGVVRGRSWGEPDHEGVVEHIREGQGA